MLPNVTTTRSPAVPDEKDAPRPWLARVALLLLVLATFGRAIPHRFVTWDDEPLIYRNPNLNPPTTAGLAWHWSNAHEHMYIPATYTAWWSIARLAQLDQADAGGTTLDPWLFHAATVLLHAGCALVVFEILRQLLGATWPALAGAAVFAVHPLQTEPAVWATGMKDVLSALLGLGALWQYLAAVDAAPGSRRRAARYALATALYALGLLAKPSVVVIPVIAALLDVLWKRRRVGDAALWVGPWLVMGAVIAAVASLVQPTGGIDAGPLWARPLIAGDALAFYLGKLAVPLHLGIDYGRTPTLVIARGYLWWTPLLPLALAVVVALSRRRAPIVAGLIFVVGLLPVLGLTPFTFQFYSTVADRYVYLSMLGVALFVGWLATAIRPRAAAAALLGLWVAALAVTSFVQAGTWRDSATLYAHAVVVNPRSYASYNNLGGIAESAGDLDTAIADFRRSIDANPVQFVPYHRLAGALQLAGRPAEARAVVLKLLDVNAQLPPALRQNPTGLHWQLGKLDLALGKPAEAMGEFERVRRVLPNDPEVAQLLDQARREASSQPTTRP